VRRDRVALACTRSLAETRPTPSDHHRGSRGQTLIEFALVAPLIFLLLFVIVDFGIALDRRITLQHAVREGARYGAVNASVAAIKQATADQAQDLIGTGDVTVCYADTPFDANVTVGDVGDSVRVKAAFSYTFPILNELWKAFGGSPLTIDMSPSATGRLELSVPGATACKP
jgi:Flp pilus assembly protein TadG